MRSGWLAWRTLALLHACFIAVLGAGIPTTHAFDNQGRTSASVPLADLPPQARETLTLIRANGPFPYARDGAIFGNREQRLPRKPRGYYHEYTVPTPGSRDRGARRIIAGRGGELYYTEDHYRRFRRIVE